MRSVQTGWKRVGEIEEKRIGGGGIDGGIGVGGGGGSSRG